MFRFPKSKSHRMLQAELTETDPAARIRGGIPAASHRVLGAVPALLPMVLLAMLPCSVSGQLTPQQAEELANYFGFGEIEMYKLDDEISHLRGADINQDGLTDVVVVNNRKSKIELLLQRKEKPQEDVFVRVTDVNELYGHWRFERKSVPINYRVSTLLIADFTRDSAPDIVFFGEPEELVLLKNMGAGQFAAPVVQRVRDGIARQRALAAGDLNGDGLMDVALLGEKDVLYFYQKPNGGLQRPVYAAHATSQPFSLDIADINGDDRDDVVIVTGGNQYHAHVRLQTSQGKLGPQQRIKLPRIRTWEFLPCLGRKQADLFAVEDVSGRLRRWKFDLAEEQTDAAEWPVLFYPFPAGEDSTNRPIALGDVNGDGLTDLLSADVKAAQLLYYQQSKSGGLEPPAKFGGQVNMRDLRVYDLDNDDTAEVLVCSADEKAIGVSRWENGRLTFPEPLTTVGEPQAFDLARRSDGQTRFVYVTKENSDFHLAVAPLFRDWRPGRGAAQSAQGPVSKVKIEDLTTAPSAVRLVDANQDGRADVLVFAPYEPLVTFLQAADGTFARLPAGAQKGLVKEATIEGFQVADVTGDGTPEILLAQRSFARALRINKNNQWMVVDQFNAPTAASEITGVTTVPNSARALPDIALYDKRNAEIHWLEPQSEGTYVVNTSLPIGTFELKAMASTRLSGRPNADLLLSDTKKFAVILPAQPALEAKELATYETKLKDAFLRRPALGDLNNDGRTDVIITDARENHVEILTFDPQEELVLASRFKIFATKRFRQREGESKEPRELLVTDLNGDRRADLALIVHDRVIVYPAQ